MSSASSAQSTSDSRFQAASSSSSPSPFKSNHLSSGTSSSSSSSASRLPLPSGAGGGGGGGSLKGFGRADSWSSIMSSRDSEEGSPTLDSNDTSAKTRKTGKKAILKQKYVQFVVQSI